MCVTHPWPEGMRSESDSRRPERNKKMKGFTRTIENFTCEKCRAEVIGNGYTNHCPKCLWSKHVDVNPGDRAGKCGGMMKPTSFEKRSKDYVIVHLCTLCGFERKNNFTKEDNFEILLAL